MARKQGDYKSPLRSTNQEIAPPPTHTNFLRSSPHFSVIECVELNKLKPDVGPAPDVT